MNRRAVFLALCAAAAGLMGAFAQTAPGAENLNEATSLEYNAANKTWRFKWWGRVGRTYFIQRSEDLVRWNWAPIVESGDNSAQEWGFTSSAGRSFVRLLYTDIPTSDPENDDFDGDGAPNLFEVMNGFSPFGRTDADNSAIPDEWEFYHAGKFAIWTPGLSAALPRNQSTNNTIYLRNDTASPVTYSVGLADHFGPSYRFEDSVRGNISYSWEEISVTGTRLEEVSTQLDAWEQVQLMGFNFPLYDSSFSRINISSKGMLTLGEAGSFQWSNHPLPSASGPANIIAAFWDDLAPDIRGDVYYREESDRFIVQYDNVANLADGDESAYTFQIVLFADGRIQFRYKSMAGLLNSATIGIQDSNHAVGLQVAYDTVYVENGMAVEINPRSSFLIVNPANGTVPVKTTLALDAIFNSWQFPPGIYTAAMTTSHNAAGATGPHTTAASLEVFNAPATVELTAPAPGTQVLQGGSLPLSATAIDPDGMQTVEFYGGATKIAEVVSAPYTEIWNNPPVGTHALTAIAIDMFGGRTTSRPVTVTVLADSDGDRMPDTWEMARFGNLAQNAYGDFDGDGYNNLEEFQLGKNPNLAEDTDNDGIPDGRERLLIYRTPSGGWGYFDPGNPDTDANGTPDGQEDYDKDGLTVLGELAIGTDPNLADTDGDAVNDGREAALGTSPLVPDPWAARDSDGDGLTDLFEGHFGSNPFNPDTNGNGMNDGEELDHGGNPRAPGPPPAPLPPPSPGPEPPGDPGPRPPDPITPGDYDILVEAKSVSFPKYGHATFQVLDPPRRFLEMFSQQSFSGGCPESGPLGVSGGKTVSIDAETGQTTTTGDGFVASGGTVQSPVRLGGTSSLHSYDDPPNEEGDCPGTITSSTTLSGENTTGMMVAAGKGKLEAFEENFQPGTPSAYRNIHDNELCFDYQKVQFKFKWKAGVVDRQRRQITYLLLFRPEDDADTAHIDESAENAEVVQTIIWNGQSESSQVFTIDPDQRKNGVDGTYSLIQAGIEVDWNRDGRIDEADRGRVSAAKPWRFWVNDNDDSGTIEGTDVPGSGHNAHDGKINGIRDLIDWFPVFLGIDQLLSAFPRSSFDYVLEQDNNALNVVETTLPPGSVGSFLKAGLGQATERDNPNGIALAHLNGYFRYINNQSALLSGDFLDRLENGNGGVILIEANKATTSPLRLVVRRKNGSRKVAEIALPLSIQPVESMYRHLNILGADGQIGGLPTDLDEPPNMPDAESSAKNFVFVHGYNVNPEQARGWFAAMFKRLWHSGSRAKFTGVTWHGYESQGTIPGLPEVTPDYQANILNAFASAPALKSGLEVLDGPIYIAAHSLGNMVVGGAMEDWGFSAAGYYMIGAAVAKEAYDETEEQRHIMSHPWWEDYDDQLRATDWHLLPWPENDWRGKLTWVNRLGTVRNAYNFYSSGEEVLMNPQHGPAAMPLGAEQVWAAQEKRKGFGMTGRILTSTYGGWEVNPHPDYGTRTEHPWTGFQFFPKTQAELGPVDASFKQKLMKTPFFNTGVDPVTKGVRPGAPADIADLLGPNGSAYASPSGKRNMLLAEMIPVKSTAAGSNPINSFGARNYDMNTMSSGWPAQRDDLRWRHSDIREVAFTFTFPVFEEIVETGELTK